jgi:hypothetical protein
LQKFGWIRGILKILAGEPKTGEALMQEAGKADPLHPAQGGKVTVRGHASKIVHGEYQHRAKAGGPSGEMLQLKKDEQLGWLLL